MDRASVRAVVNKLVDMLLEEDVDTRDILEELDLSDSELDYIDLQWLKTYGNN